MKDGGNESTCIYQSWLFHETKNTSGGEISSCGFLQVLSRRLNPKSTARPRKTFSKNIRRRIFEDRRDAEGV